MIDYSTLKDVPVDYDSPLVMNIIEHTASNIARAVDDGAMKAIVKAGFEIDKDKMVQALQQDKERYSDAYRRGHADGYKKREDEIVRCKDCKFNCAWKQKDPDWFCADGERRTDDA